MLKTINSPQSGLWWAYPKGRQRISVRRTPKGRTALSKHFMVKLTENKLIIELESSDPAALLRDLQESLLRLISYPAHLEEGINVEKIDTVNCVALLQAMLPDAEAYERLRAQLN